MIQRRHGACFALEPLRELVLRNLDGDFAAQASIGGAIYFAHPALTELGGGDSEQWFRLSFCDRRRATPQFVEEVQQEGHLDIPLLFRWRVQFREHSKAIAVRRQIIVRISVDVVKLLIGPHARFASHERVSRRRVILHHDAVVQILEE